MSTLGIFVGLFGTPVFHSLPFSDPILCVFDSSPVVVHSARPRACPKHDYYASLCLRYSSLTLFHLISLVWLGDALIPSFISFQPGRANRGPQRTRRTRSLLLNFIYLKACHKINTFRWDHVVFGHFSTSNAKSQGP